MSFKKIISLFAAALVILGASSGSASAECPIQTWSRTQPPVNQLLIFCGDLTEGTPQGYNSRVYAPSTHVVTGIRNAIPTMVYGIYSAEVIFNNGTTKFSVFFPDNCTQSQIVTSVIYANAHPLVPQPVVPSGYVGPSAPAAHWAVKRDHGREYCRDITGNPFNIQYVRLANGNINLAFPN